MSESVGYFINTLGQPIIFFGMIIVGISLIWINGTSLWKERAQLKRK